MVREGKRGRCDETGYQQTRYRLLHVRTPLLFQTGFPVRDNGDGRRRVVTRGNGEQKFLAIGRDIDGICRRRFEELLWNAGVERVPCRDIHRHD